MTIKRITFVQEMLKFMGLEGRLHLEWISSAEAQKFARVVTDFTEKITHLGPSPIAGQTRSISMEPHENKRRKHEYHKAG
ncbi:Methyl-viologen-reducing hydrogenase, delta subunit [Desulfocicer vacuolatum DSM 3385]|uniref:Methyl-viologen-reducing hydrogenase, delta subunit n=2 Tax=Desulfocicer vacuolatum TaxID=2298 RepID=A0A1W2EG42_9BACT|nr:Methyl-viologen-reducing hydrogenase, delta subunit [Desulfocicer vacuolatum DSM 3385]